MHQSLKSVSGCVFDLPTDPKDVSKELQIDSFPQTVVVNLNVSNDESMPSFPLKKIQIMNHQIMTHLMEGYFFPILL